MWWPQARVRAGMRAPTPSWIRKDTTRTMHLLGLPYEVGRIAANGCIAIDIALELNGRRIAVMADGPRQYTSNLPVRELGRTLGRNRLLAAAGWSVLSVPYFEWDRLKKKQAKVRYLVSRLRSFT